MNFQSPFGAGFPFGGSSPSPSSSPSNSGFGNFGGFSSPMFGNSGASNKNNNNNPPSSSNNGLVGQTGVDTKDRGHNAKSGGQTSISAGSQGGTQSDSQTRPDGTSTDNTHVQPFRFTFGGNAFASPSSGTSSNSFPQFFGSMNFGGNNNSPFGSDTGSSNPSPSSSNNNQGSSSNPSGSSSVRQSPAPAPSSGFGNFGGGFPFGNMGSAPSGNSNGNGSGGFASGPLFTSELDFLPKMLPTQILETHTHTLCFLTTLAYSITTFCWEFQMINKSENYRFTMVLDGARELSFHNGS